MNVMHFALASLVAVAPLSAATIEFVGSDTTTGGSWRTTNVNKALDPDNDNIYGEAGHVFFSTSVGSTGGGWYHTVASYNPVLAPRDMLAFDYTYQSVRHYTRDTAPSFLDVSNNGTNTTLLGGWERASFDSPDVSAGDDVANIEVRPGVRDGTRTNSVLSFTVGEDAPAAVRVGVIVRSSGTARMENVRLTPTGGSAVTATNATSTTGFTYYFFDVTGASLGDTFSLAVTRPDTGQNWIGLYGLTFDVVPEPASLALLAAGGVAIAFRRRG